MKPEEQQFMEQQDATMRTQQANVEAQQQAQLQQSMLMQEQEKSMIKEQLDLRDELDHIEHLLKGEFLQQQKDGSVDWAKPKDKKLVLLSDYGIHLIMNTLNFYINKNTLLSNYDEETILTKMEDFASDLADTIFMEYEKVFEYPTLEECQEILKKRIERKMNLRSYSEELLGRKVDGKEIEDRIIKELEGKVEKELDKIKEQLIKNKLKRFMILLRTIQDAVHSTYLRAWRGQERTTLRQHIHISETKGGNQYQNQGAGINPMTWFKKK